ncbi:unnamed protein product [Phaeothamnion confervicola]
MTTPEEARLSLETSQQQLAQIDGLLAQSPGDAQLLGLRADVVEAMTLSQEILEAFGAQGNGGGAGGGGGASSSAAAASSDQPPQPPPPPPPPPLPVHEASVSDDIFGVGSRVEVLSGVQWLPAWITAPSPDGGFVVRLYGSGTKEQKVSLSSIRRLVPQPYGFQSGVVTAGQACQAVFREDGQFYEAVVTEVTAYGYRVTFTGYGNSEEVPLEYLRRGGSADAVGGTAAGAAAAAGTGAASFGSSAAGAASGRGTSGELPPVPAAALDEDGNFKIPDNLKPHPGDTDAERERKRKKIKALKSRVRLRQKDEETTHKQSSWQAFASGKGASKPAKGSLKGLRKESIFRSPDAPDGRVGVTGSGQGMTGFEGRKKLKTDL